jgi:hypothetical protein
MEYYELYEVLKSHFDSVKETIEIKGFKLTIESVPFETKVSDLAPWSENQECPVHQESLKINENAYMIYHQPSVDIKDFDIACNKKFEYYILKRADIETAKGCIIFFHGK